jgi:hypothetical protein
MRKPTTGAVIGIAITLLFIVMGMFYNGGAATTRDNPDATASCDYTSYGQEC